MLTWFRFIYPFQNLIQTGRSDKLLQIIEQGYQQFVGKILERWFLQKYNEEGSFTQIGQWWDSKGENEIDLLALDYSTRTAVIAEIKINKNKISLPILEKKVEKIKPNLLRYKKQLISLSTEDM